MNRTLDRTYQLDWRSLDYAVGTQVNPNLAYRPRSYTWSIDEWLDQGEEGACVGFAFAHELVARPQLIQGVTNAYAQSLYFAAQKIDEWKGGAYPGASPFYEGTSVLAGAKVLQGNGYYTSYYWGISLEEVARGLSYFGPCVLGVNWYEGMFDTDADGFIHPIGRIGGGHAILAHAIKIKYKPTWWGWWRRSWRDVDLDRSYVTLHNSWGQKWGVDGKAYLSLTDLGRLLSEQGDACFPERSSISA